MGCRVFFSAGHPSGGRAWHVRAGLLSRASVRLLLSKWFATVCLSLYTDASNWQAVAVADTGADIKLGFVGRNYAHKNTRIFLAVIDTLRRDHGIKACILRDVYQ